MSGQRLAVYLVELPVRLPLALVVGLVVHDWFGVDDRHSRFAKDVKYLGSCLIEVDIFVILEEIDVAVLLCPAVNIFGRYIGNLYGK